MASKIILKKSSVAAKAPVAGDLDFGELAINYTDSKLYFKKADGSIDAFTSAAASAPVTSVGGNIGDITDTQLLTSIKNVDGSGSGLDADFLDGNHASAFYLASNPNGYTSNTGTVTSVGATAPLVSSGGTAPSISIPAANSTTNGYMSSAYASKLDGIAAGATNVTNTNQLTNGAGYITSSGSITGSAGSVPWSGVTSRPSNIMYYQGFTLDANTMDSNSTGFTYSVNAPYTGPVARFSTGGGYDLWLNSAYSGGNTLAFRTRNGDASSINAWKYLVSYGVNYGDSIYASIYYDANDTAYYTDQNSTSSYYRINVNNNILFTNYGRGMIGTYASTRYQAVFAMGDSYKLPDDGTTTGSLYGLAWSHPNAGGTAGNLNTHGLLVLENGGFLAAVSGSIRSRDDMRSPIFYDSNNTGYYNDPASVSYLYGLTLAGGSYFRPQNWIQLDGSYGLYWPNHYGAHLHANDLSTYTQIALRGGKNSYGGIYDQYSAVNGFMYDGGGNGGVYREANGRWYFYYHLSNDCMSIGTSGTSSSYGVYCNKGAYYGSRVDATIFYDSNNTGYYADLNNTTYLYYLQSATTVRADSDRRLKENITPITSALSLVRQLQGCRYTRNDLADKTKVYIGMIAQDVLPIVPEVVSGSEAGKYSLGYAELVPVLNEAVKELDEIVSKQAAIIAKLEERLSKLLDD